jgi:hypothetical protein
MYRTFCLTGVVVLTAALPALAHCGKCAVDGRAFADALKAGKVNLATATTLAETTTKGVAVRAAVHHHEDGSFVEVHCMVADKIMAVEVDCKTGMPGKPVEVKNLESHVTAVQGAEDEAGDDVSQADVPPSADGIADETTKVDKLADSTAVRAKLNEVTMATEAGELDRADKSLAELEALKDLSESLQSRVKNARTALDAARALSYAKKDSPDLP